jgi:hypothetical protein
MITTFTLLCDRCGLSHREAAAFLNVRPDTVKSWSSGRNAAPAGAINELRALYAMIERAASEAVSQAAALEASGRAPDVIELALASDDHEAQQPPLGWPCVGAQAAMLGIVAAKLGRPVKIVPRGSTPATAVAADRHDKVST